MSAHPPPAGPVTIVAHDVGAVGGMERVLAELIRGLAQRGHEVTVIARTCALEPHQRVHFHRVRAPARPVLLAYPWFALAGSLALRRWGRGVVQSTGAIVLQRVPVIAIHYCHQVGPANPSRSSLLFRVHSALAGLMYRAAERVCYRANRRAWFVCVSDGVADEMRAAYPSLAERVLTIRNGVDTEAFAPGLRRQQARAERARLELSDSRPTAVFVGSEWERKGLEPAVEALALAGEWDLLVAGSGDRRRYQQRADALGVGAAIRWLGVSTDVALVYQLADAFLLPTSYETFSLVTYEAAASGLPLLATPVSGVRELVRDGENGYFITREPGLIAERLRRLGADPALRERMGQSARVSALGFTWLRMVDAHHELYQRIAPAPRR